MNGICQLSFMHCDVSENHLKLLINYYSDILNISALLLSWMEQYIQWWNRLRKEILSSTGLSHSFIVTVLPTFYVFLQPCIFLHFIKIKSNKETHTKKPNPDMDGRWKGAVADMLWFYWIKVQVYLENCHWGKSFLLVPIEDCW